MTTLHTHRPPRSRTRSPRRRATAAFTLLLAVLPFLLAGCDTTQKTTAAPAVRGVEPEMRIRVVNAGTNIAVAASRGVDIDGAGNTAGRVTIPGNATVRLADDVWIVQSGASNRRFPSSRPLSLRASGGGVIKVDNAPYAGKVVLHPREDVSPGAFDVVANVPMERYIAGVISKELISSWSRGAFEAQAIAARSYAMNERQRHLAAGDHFELESTTADQVYGGESSNPTALAAVQATRGLVLMFGGKPLRAYYSSTCGGRPTSARDIWPTGPGYEFNAVSPIQAHNRGHWCQGTPLYRWTVRRDSADVAKRLSAYAARNGFSWKAIRGVSSIQVARRSALGRPIEFTVRDSSGKSWTIPAEHLRHACNFADAPGLGAITRDVRVHSHDFEAAVSGSTITFTGRGFGHGVGMCQYCAQGLGSRSESGRSIVMKFYPGATIQKIY